MNKTMICGNLTVDPVIYEREYPNRETGEIIKTRVCNFTVAVDDGYGERKNTQYFRVNAWRGLGESCQKYLRKGRGVLVCGPVSLNNYVNKDNNLRSMMEIRADEIQFLPDTKRVETPKEPDVQEEDLY